jgi:ligand-binding sensor domain-containing protein
MLAALTLAATLECVVPRGPTLAEVRLPDGSTARARDGAVEIDARVLTFCDGLPDAHPTALAVFRGALVVGFRRGGAQRFDGHRFIPIAGAGHRAVRALAASPDTLWIGTAEGLLRVDDAGTHRDPHPVLGRREITALHLAKDGTLHVGAGAWGRWRRSGTVTRHERGVYVGCFRESHGRVEARPPGPGCQAAPPDGPGLASGHISALEHIDDHLYIATFDHGLYRRAPDGRITRVEEVPPFVNALTVDGARLYVGTTDGLYRIDGGAVARVELGLPGEHVNALHLGGDGVLRVATSQGLAELGPTGTRLLDERAGLPTRFLYAVTRTEDGAVWVGTAAGAVRLADGAARQYSQASGALPHDWVTALLPDGDGVLAGTYDAGVVRLAPDGHGRALPGLERAWVNPGGLVRIDDHLYVLTLGDGLLDSGPRGLTRMHLPDDDVTALVPTGGALFIGTRGGLVRAAL